MRKHNLTPSQLAQVVEDTKATNAVAESRPTWGDIKDALKREPAPGADGVLKVDGRGKREMAVIGEMMRPAWRKESDRGMTLQSRVTRVPMKDAQGRVHMVREESQDRIGRKKNLHRVGGYKPNLVEREGRWYRYVGREEWREVQRIEGRWVEV